MANGQVRDNIDTAYRNAGGAAIPMAGEANYWTGQLANGNLLKGDEKIASDEHVALNQLSPQLLSDYSLEEAARGGGLPWYAQLVEDVALGAATGGIGSAVAGAAGGGAVGAVAGGAAAGGSSAALGSIYNGTPLTAGGIGKGALMGGVGGGVGYGLGSNGLGLSNSVARPLAGATTGAIGGALSGQGALQGAESGAARGAMTATTGAVAGSILGSGNTIYSSGDASQPSPIQANPQAPSPMSSYYNFSGGNPFPYDPTDPSYNESNPGFNPLYTDNGNGQAVGISPNVNLGQSGGSSMGAGGVGNGSILGSLASLFGGSSGISPSLLGSLLGMGSGLAGNLLNSSAAKGAAGTFANQTKFNPYSVATNNGTTGFNGTNMFSNLSPGAQANANSLNGLTQNSAASLAAGPSASANNYFNQLQQQQKQGNSQFVGSNLDNQFANGVMGSTAGQYQTGAALNAVNNQTMQDQTQAQNFANTQQQQQLNNLTAGLSGLNTINQSQLAAGQLGASVGGTASSANNGAYQPSLAANSGSPIGSLLTGLSGSYNSGQANSALLSQYLGRTGG